MNRTVWLKRAAAVTVLASGVVIVLTSTQTAMAAWDVGQARKTIAETPAPPKATDTPWAAPAPLLKVGSAPAATIIAEFLNANLGPMGLTLTSTDVSPLLPLGEGLRLAEIRMEARADPAAVQAVAEWVAVNREAVRLRSISSGLGPDDTPTASFVLLMVTS